MTETVWRRTLTAVLTVTVLAAVALVGVLATRSHPGPARTVSVVVKPTSPTTAVGRPAAGVLTPGATTAHPAATDPHTVTTPTERIKPPRTVKAAGVHVHHGAHNPRAARKGAKPPKTHPARPAAAASDVVVAEEFAVAYTHQNVNRDSPAVLAHRVAPYVTRAYDHQLAAIPSGGGLPKTARGRVLTAQRTAAGAVNLELAITEGEITTQEAWSVGLTQIHGRWTVTGFTVE